VRRVLLADDNRDAADTLALLLKLSSHEVRVAHGGREALALAEELRPDVALLDIAMPEIDGYAVAQALRRAPWAAGLRLIALTGRGQEEDKLRARAAGFDHHLTKPVSPEALQELLQAG
jgi:CheY-like chemotaxis protein